MVIELIKQSGKRRTTDSLSSTNGALFIPKERSISGKSHLHIFYYTQWPPWNKDKHTIVIVEKRQRKRKPCCLISIILSTCFIIGTNTMKTPYHGLGKGIKPNMLGNIFLKTKNSIVKDKHNGTTVVPEIICVGKTLKDISVITTHRMTLLLCLIPELLPMLLLLPHQCGFRFNKQWMIIRKGKTILTQFQKSEGWIDL